MANTRTSGDGLYFRRLRSQDAQAMNAVEQACFSMPWSLAQCKGALSQKFFAAYGLWRRNTLLAYISFYYGGNEVEILNLAVMPAERRKGHALRILSLLLQVGQKMGMQRVLLEVREGNLAAISLYEKTGFQKCGCRPRYYSDSGEDALIYCRVL